LQLRTAPKKSASENIGGIMSTIIQLLSKDFLKAGDDRRIHHYHSITWCDEQMADGLCISHQYTMVGIAITALMIILFHCYGEYHAIKPDYQIR